MPAIKVIRKTDSTAAKNVKKPVQKTAKKVTSGERWENIEKGFERIQKTIDEVAAQHRETEKASKDAWKAIWEMQRNIGG
ncbi:MAG: hypothetical protein LBG84_07560, partial [Treponema sp.]|nr:hypothetical protein [Treponema sp.]